MIDHLGGGQRFVDLLSLARKIDQELHAVGLDVAVFAHEANYLFVSFARAFRIQRSDGLAFEIFHLAIFRLGHQHVFRPAYLAQDQPDWYSRDKGADGAAARHRVVHVTGHQSFYVDSSPDIDKVGFDPFSEKKTSLPGDLRNQEAGERPA